MAGLSDQRLGFRIGEARLAVSATTVTEVVRRPRLTRVPHAPPSLLGLTQLRGATVPVVSLARLMGRPRAIRYLYDGNLISAAEAERFGLVDEICEASELRARVQAYAEELAAKPAAALAAIRRTITLGGGKSFEGGMRLELETAAALAGTADFAEGIDAFLARRPPRWAD